MLTEPFLAVEPEFVGSVYAEYTRLQGVAVAAGPQTVHDRCYQRGTVSAGVARVAAHVDRQLKGARVESRRQIDVVLQAHGQALWAMVEAGVAGGAVAHQIAQGPLRHPLQIRCHGGRVAVDHRFLGGRVQHHNPRPVVGLQGYLVAHRRALYLQVGGGLQAGREGRTQRPPLAPVEGAQNRSTEIQVTLPRHRVVKADAHGNAAVQCEAGNGADLHGGRQAAAPAHGVRWHPPQWRNAREQHKQHRHDGCTQQSHPAGCLGSHPQRWAAHRHVAVDQCREQA